MGQKKTSTRGNKNTATIKKEDPSMAEMRETTKERFTLTKESIETKANYQKSFVQLKNYNNVIKTFLKEYGQQLNIKELTSLVTHHGYKAGKFQELTLAKLQHIFVAGNVFKKVLVPGIVRDSIEKVAMPKDDLHKILVDIANSDLSSFIATLKLVDADTYKFDDTYLYGDNYKRALQHQQDITSYVSGLKIMDLKAFEENFFEPLLLELRDKTKLPISTIVQKTKEVYEAFVARDALIDAMYKSSSAEVIEAINSDEYKCQNPTNDPEITKNNNKAIQKISGEDDNLDLPQETSIYSDFVFHSEHATSQCELQETLKLEKNFQAAKTVILAEQILRDCSQAQIQELNANYDKEISELSTSTAVAISNNNQEKCDQLENNYHTFDANIALLFDYKAADDSEILAAMEKVKPVVSLDTEGQATMSETYLKSKHSADSANIKSFTEIRDDLNRNNEHAAMKAIENGQGLNLDDQMSFYKANESGDTSDTSSTAKAATETTLTCVGNVEDTDCIGE